MTDLPDIQGTKALRSLAIPKVGIRKIRVPIRLIGRGDRTNGPLHSPEKQTVEGECSVYVNLDEGTKGINMSRLAIAVHEAAKEEEIALKFLQNVLTRLHKTHPDSTDVYIKVRFNYLIHKQSPSTDNWGFAYVPIVIEGQSNDSGQNFYQSIKVQFIATCPCSKELSIHSQEVDGVPASPHQQRGFATVTVPLTEEKMILFEDIIETIHNAVQTYPYPIIKRPDEKEIAVQSWANTLFVEDAAREIAYLLNGIEDILDYVVVVENEESIHEHNAVAILPKGILGGLR